MLMCPTIIKKNFLKQRLLLICVLLLSSFTATYAQPEAPQPRNVELINEYSDGLGHIIRIVRFKQGNMVVTQTIIMPKIQKVVHIPINPDTLRKDSIRVAINKTNYTLDVYYRRQWIRSYRAVFGPKPQLDKMMEGDRCTPEGLYKISIKNPNSKYDRFMGISYPDDAARKRFKQHKDEGKIPSNATIGGNVGIHGIWQGGDDLIEMGVGWTDGCIALKNRDIEELYTLVGVGTTVYISR